MLNLVICRKLLLSILLTTASLSAQNPPAIPAPAVRDGQHDFDFEIGSWKAHLRRLVKPLSGSTTWIELDGTSVVRKIWDGKANIGELEVSAGDKHVEGLTLRLYNPESHQWRLSWANSNDGLLAVPTVGQFYGNGVGEFYDTEDFNGRAILVRFLFLDVTKDSFRTEQAFSADGGKTWETNWIGTFTRIKDQPR